MPLLLQIIAGLSLLYLLATGAIYAFQRRLMYNPHTHVNTPHRDKSPALETVNIETADGLTLVSYYAAPKTGKDGRPMPTVLYLHGNTGEAGDAAHKLIPIVNAGYGAMLVEYRGFGKNAGKPTEKGLITDAQAALDFINRRQAGKARVVYYGMSMGTGVANGLAAIRPPAGLVLECGFTSMTDAAQYHYKMFPIKYLIKDTFNSKQRIKSLTAPVLFLHGERDRTVPVEQGKEMYETAPVADKTLKLYPDGGHINLYDFGASDDVVDWLNRHYL